MTSLESTRPGRAMAWLVLIIAVLTILLLSWHSLTDRDVWLHARTGRDILSTGRVPSLNTYSFTAPEHPWIDHEWLFQVLIAVTGPTDEALGPGPDGVRGWNLLRTGLALILALVLMLGDGGIHALRHGRAPGHTAAIGAAALFGSGLLWTRLILRPELISAILLVVILRSVEAVLARGIPHPRSWLDPRHPAGRANWLTVLWSQIHGFAAFAAVLWLLAALAVVAAPALRSISAPGAGEQHRWRTALLGALCAGLALAATPNGYEGALYPLHALGQFGPDRPQLGTVVSELVPTLATRDALGTTILVFKLSLVWSVAWIILQWGRVPLLRVLVLLVAAGVALAGQRGLGPYAVAFVLLHTRLDGMPRWPLMRYVKPRAGLAIALVVLAGVTVVAGSWWLRVTDDRFYLTEGVARRWGEGLAPAHAPVDAARAVGQLGPIRVVANIDAAGCLLAHGRPLLFIDGRTEAYPPELWLDYDDLRAGGALAYSQLALWQPDAVCLTLAGPFALLAGQLQQDPDWRLVHAGPVGAVFTRGAAPPAGADPAVAARKLLASASAPALSTARAADLTLAAAALYRLAGDPEGAAAALATGARLRPDHAVLRHNLGNALMATEDFAAAREHFLAALAANGRLAGAALNAGVCAVRLGLTDDAIAGFRRAVSIDPELFGAWANLGALLAARGDTESALEALERGLALRPEDSALQGRINQLRRRPAR